MNIEFDDACWEHDDDDWRRSLAKLLMALEAQAQHAVLADQQGLLDWCVTYLPLFVDYFRTRLAQAQPRPKGLEVTVAPSGADLISGAPPWNLLALPTLALVTRPLRMVLENNNSDLAFIQATLPRFRTWKDKGWVVPEMGGGSAMMADIQQTAADGLLRWRTFYLFDSDRLHPDELLSGWSAPSGDGCQGYVFERACTSMPATHWHRLNRRSIENYLPMSILHTVDAGTATALADPAVGQMVNFYNMKYGNMGDSATRAKTPNSIRIARSKGFWTSLPQPLQDALGRGFGEKVSENFAHLSPTHAWPADISSEVTALEERLQDVM